MRDDSLTRSFEAHGVYYAMRTPVYSPEVNARYRQQQLLNEIYHKACAMASHMQRLEARMGYKYSPDEPRIPAGQTGGGEWTSGGASPDPGRVEESYVLDALIGLGGSLVSLGAEALGAASEAIGLTEGADAVGGTAADASLTEHGALRLGQRGITSSEVQDAMQTARDTGNVTTQIGKYGTPQNLYRGSNGVTVVEETSGRNAGKVITSYRH